MGHTGRGRWQGRYLGSQHSVSYQLHERLAVLGMLWVWSFGQKMPNSSQNEGPKGGCPGAGSRPKGGLGGRQGAYDGFKVQGSEFSVIPACGLEEITAWNVRHFRLVAYRQGS